MKQVAEYLQNQAAPQSPLVHCAACRHAREVRAASELRSCTLPGGKMKNAELARHCSEFEAK